MKIYNSDQKYIGHLTYCSNIHPGETWEEVFAQLQRHIPAVHQRLAPEKPFGIGLRLSAEAASTLNQKDELHAFKNWLTDHNAYVFTINAFPYGKFHGQPVKAQVYRPDWSTQERVDYTLNCARILAALLPDDTTGSLSSIPGAFKGDIDGEQYRTKIVSHLVHCAIALHTLYEDTGKQVCIALEPEPSCMLETTEESIAFFNEELFCAESIAQFSQATGLTLEQSERNLRQYLTLCLDTCHAAVMFESPTESAIALRQAKIKIGKIQLTAALAINQHSEAAIEALQAFSDPVYLHQTMVKQQEDYHFFLDLPEACASDLAKHSDTQWRSHFHVPVFLEKLAEFDSTSPALKTLVEYHSHTPLSEHLEVETYTFHVLPKAFQLANVDDNIVRELAWTLEQLS